MSNPMFSPGPWTRNANGDLIFSAPVYPAADDPKRLCSREIGRITGYRTFFGEANAQLIVAAPETLEALKSCVEWMEFTIPQLHTKCPHCHKPVDVGGLNWGGPVGKARDAISKATKEPYL